jgi:DNA polymerase-1
MSIKKPLLILVDGYGLIFRAYYTVREMTHNGEPTNALYGFVSMLLKILDFKPDAILVAFDWHGITERKKEYEPYKAHREEAPLDMKQQINRLRWLVQSMGMDWMEGEGHEADDIIGSLARHASSHDYNVEIVTGDHDLCQLVDENVKVLFTVKGTSEFKLYDEDAVIEKFGVGPKNVVDYKGLVGDPSDNIPGVKGVGEVTAKKLLAEYGNIDEIYKNLENINPESLRTKLEISRKEAFLSRKLATIRTDLDIELPDTAKIYFNPEGAYNAFKELGFTSFIKRLQLEDRGFEIEETPRPSRSKAYVIQNMKELDKLIAEITKKGEFAFDVETTSLDARTTGLVGISIAISEFDGWYIPVGHRDSADLLSMSQNRYSNLPLKEVIGKLKSVMEDEKIGKIGQNAKFEYLTFANQGIHIRNISFDTMVASYVINPDDRHNLKELGRKWLNRDMQQITELIGSGKKQISMEDVPIENVAPYAVDDATVTWALSWMFRKDIEKESFKDLFYQIELPMVTVLAEMEREGIKIDAKVLLKISAELEKELDEIAKSAHKLLQRSINLNSPQQLKELLFEYLKLPNPAKGSTGIEILEEIKDAHPIVPLIIEHRTTSKIRSTYAEGLLSVIDPNDSRIHSSFNQTMTTTGRLSSSEPNLQTIPIRTEKGRLIRKAFMPNGKEEILLSADYSQIELRLLAHYSQDDVLIEAFKNNEDIHYRTAKEILPLKDGIVTPNDRRMAKTVNFGIIYGMGAFSLSKDLGISRKQAQDFIDQYFARYPKVRVFFENLLQKAREVGYVETFMKRRRYMPDLISSNSMKRSMAERAAINMPLQGGAADIMKKAMVELSNELSSRKLKSKLILQVHDEILLSVHKSEMDDVSKLVNEIMTSTCTLAVPLVANLKTGHNWYDMKDVEV